MIYGVILAGGKGTRMGNVEKPKQFIHIGNKPIIIHTIEKFIISNKFKHIVVPCPKQWITYAEDVVKKYLPNNTNVTIVEGGGVRNESILNAIKYIDEMFGIDDNTIVVTHDAVRPFVTYRIIDENINNAMEGFACDTVVPATDTIVESEDGEYISVIPNRANFFQGQTPQSFKAKKFVELYAALSEEEKMVLTDAAKVFVVKGEPVKLIQGEYFNIKVTYPYDVQLAEVLLSGEQEC